MVKIKNNTKSIKKQRNQNAHKRVYRLQFKKDAYGIQKRQSNKYINVLQRSRNNLIAENYNLRFCISTNVVAWGSDCAPFCFINGSQCETNHKMLGFPVLVFCAKHFWHVTPRQDNMIEASGTNTGKRVEYVTKRFQQDAQDVMGYAQTIEKAYAQIRLYRGETLMKNPFFLETKQDADCRPAPNPPTLLNAQSLTKQDNVKKWFNVNEELDVPDIMNKVGAYYDGILFKKRFTQSVECNLDLNSVCEIIQIYGKLSCVSFCISATYRCHTDYRSALEIKLVKVRIGSGAVLKLHWAFEVRRSR